MRYEEAIELFERLGEQVRGKTAEQLRASRNRLLHRHHSDHGGDTQITREILEAFSFIHDGVPELTPSQPTYRHQEYTYRRTNQNAPTYREMAEKRAKEQNEKLRKEMQAASVRASGSVFDSIDKEIMQRRAEEKLRNTTAPQTAFLCDDCLYCSQQDGKLITCTGRPEIRFRMTSCAQYLRN